MIIDIILFASVILLVVAYLEYPFEHYPKGIFERAVHPFV